VCSGVSANCIDTKTVVEDIVVGEEFIERRGGKNIEVDVIIIGWV
jgi:hypothetical protein